MRIAASTSTTRELPLGEAVGLAADLGYDAIEVWAEHLWDQGVAPGVLRAAAASRGLDLTLHGPQRDLNVTSTNAGIRRESQRQYLSALDDAAAMGASLVVFHPGATSSSGDDAAAFWPPLDEFFRKIAERAAALGLRAGIENMERRHLEFVTTPELVVGLLTCIGHPALGLTLDLAHQFYNGDDLHLEGLRPHLLHVHVSGSTREKVHVPLADGIHVLQPSLVALAGFFSGLVTIEGFVRGRAREVLQENIQTIRAWLAH
jgi:sugar phosphate isomerase/epimerase